jgi:hypothetical protein
MQPFYRFECAGGNPVRLPLAGVAAQSQFAAALHGCRNHAVAFIRILTCGCPIGPIISNDLPVEPWRLNLAFMTVPLVTACFALLAAVLHFVSYKLKKTAERKSFHVKDAT